MAARKPFMFLIILVFLSPLSKAIVNPSTPVVVGKSSKDRLVFGHYYALVQVGTPPKSFHLTLDTSTDITWLQCNFCHECHHQDDPYFNPSSSSTYKPLPCKSPQCGVGRISPSPTAAQLTCNNQGNCDYQVSYNSQCYSQGDFIAEKVSFKNFVKENIALGCGHYQEGFYTSSAGTLGLGAGPLSFPSQIKASSFSFCLTGIHSGRESTLDFNTNMPTNSITAPLLVQKNSTYYHLGLSGISVGGKHLVHVGGHGAGAGVVIDSATQYTWLPSQEYSLLRDVFIKTTAELNSVRPSVISWGEFDTCYELAEFKRRARFPTMSLHFVGGKVLSLPEKNYVIPVDDEAAIFCLAFGKVDGKTSFMGNTQLQGMRVSFDLKNSIVGFSPNSC